MIFDLTKNELGRWVGDQGYPKSHSEHILRWLYRSWPEMDDNYQRLPKLLRSRLESVSLRSQIQKVHASGYDGSRKFAIKLHDDKLIEAVLMPESRRLTLCLSSQVGCAQGCTFCYTARMGLDRQLKASEIVEQVVLANQWIRENPDWLVSCGHPPEQRVTNIVFMGMGEPLDNVEEVIQAINILKEPLGLGIAKRKISVSTAGHLDGLRRLHEALPGIPVALSLHEPDHGKRSRLMPINARYPLADILGYFRTYFREVAPRGHLLIQYTLIRGVNDGESKAMKLIELLAGIPVKINIIPLNEIEPSRFQSPSGESVQSFRDRLQQHGLRVMVRYSKGQDIQAACGQLVAKDLH